MRVLFRLIAFISIVIGYPQITTAQTPATENFINGSIDLLQDAYYSQKSAKQRQAYLEKMQKRRSEMQELYTTMAPYPDSIKEGWHDVVVMNNEFLCAERKVYVRKNKIIKYVAENWLERKVNVSGAIKAGKAAITVEDKSELESGLITVYFFNYISDNNSFTTAPLKPAVVTFWTSYKYHKYLSLTFDNVYLGKFEKHFDKDSNINCLGEFGTFTIRYKPGTYKYETDSGGAGVLQHNWKGEITLNEGDCIVVPLVK